MFVWYTNRPDGLWKPRRVRLAGAVRAGLANKASLQSSLVWRVVWHARRVYRVPGVAPQWYAVHFHVDGEFPFYYLSHVLLKITT